MADCAVLAILAGLAVDTRLRDALIVPGAHGPTLIAGAVWIQRTDHAVDLHALARDGAPVAVPVLLFLACSTIVLASALGKAACRTLAALLGLLLGGVAANVCGIAAHGEVVNWLVVRLPGQRPFAYSTGDMMMIGAAALCVLAGVAIAWGGLAVPDPVPLAGTAPSTVPAGATARA
jgi:hypothetical protein